MVSASKLRRIIKENHFTQKEVAEYIGITPKTFYEKMKSGVFLSNEIEAMLEILHFSEDPLSVFFSSWNAPRRDAGWYDDFGKN